MRAANSPVPAQAARATMEKSPRGPALATVAQLSAFDEVIDVRSESEFAEDHVPGAINCPVLDDAERARVGTLYRRSPFEAKKVGAALVSANIARHLRERLFDRAREWRPLVYCWRGGSRSEALAHVLNQVGWRAARLDGGYRAYRRWVIEQLGALPGRHDWRVVCGLTGTGKTRLLKALHDAGAQVLDLESLAAHRGSVLGGLPGAPQPSQKMFESLLARALAGFGASRPVYVEAESRKIGALRLPEALVEAMRKGRCIVIESAIETRVALLKREYGHFFTDVEALNERLACLAPLHGHAVVDGWKALARAENWDALTAELLQRHYDPAYTRSIARHYPAPGGALALHLQDIDDASFERLARRCLSPAGSP
jgi:tRNA 2-selenouridine synthase